MDEKEIEKGSVKREKRGAREEEETREGRERGDIVTEKSSHECRKVKLKEKMKTIKKKRNSGARGNER